MFPLAHSKLVFGLLSLKYHMCFLEHYRVIIRIMLHPSHINSGLNEKHNSVQLSFMSSHMPFLLVLSSKELQPTCHHYFENNQLKHVIWTISTHMSSLYSFKSLLFLDMIQQWFDSPQDTSPHSLISALTQWKYPWYLNAQAIACSSPSLSTSNPFPCYLQSIKPSLNHITKSISSTISSLLEYILESTILRSIELHYSSF